MSEESQYKAIPTRIVLNKTKDLLTITFDNDEVGEYEAEFLRVYSPSAEVKGHGSEQRKLQPGKRHVKIRSLEQVGHYAIKPVFDDGHDTGIYSWAYFYELLQDKETLWSNYIAELEEAGLSRDR